MYGEIIDCCIDIRQCTEDIQTKISDYKLLHNELPKESEQILHLMKEAYAKLNQAADILYKSRV